MTIDKAYKNAVLDDKELQEALKNVNPKFGDFVTRVAGEAWGLPLIDQKTKALITIAVDVVNQDQRGPGNPFPAHVNMALQQGATRQEIEELLLFMCTYAGFNKVAGCFGTLNEIFNQDIVSPMNGNPNVQTGLANYLQGVQHFGITVDDLPKALEFYTEVLGGKPAIGGDGFGGEDLHNLLFQQEEIYALESGVEPKSIGVPNIRDGSQELLDVRFISFGNTCIELIHFRRGDSNPCAHNTFGKLSSGIGYVNNPHISFHVKDDVDLDMFAQMLEAECERRGIKNIVANKVIRANSKEELKNLPPKYAKTDFAGDFEGWALFYCKGPNGEQLEFNQVTRKAKQNFKRAQQEYNQNTGTNFAWASDTINTSKNITQEPARMQSSTLQPKSNFDNLPGEKINLVKEMFKAGESMNVDNFVKFYTDDALYQFSNFPIVYGPKGIKDSSTGFLEQVESLYHKIWNIWEVGTDTVICEMEVTYIRHDGKVFTLPCCDTIRFKGDKVSELRIYMDISPVFGS